MIHISRELRETRHLNGDKRAKISPVKEQNRGVVE